MNTEKETIINMTGEAAIPVATHLSNEERGAKMSLRERHRQTYLAFPFNTLVILTLVDGNKNPTTKNMDNPIITRHAAIAKLTDILFVCWQNEL